MQESNAYRWGLLAGIAFAILLVAGLIFIGQTPDTDATPEEIADFYDDDWNHARVVLGFYIWTVAALAFAWFTASVRTALRPVLGRSRTVSFLAFSVGLLFPVLLMSGAAASASVSGAILVGGASGENIGADASWLFPQLGFGIIQIPGALSAAAFIALVTALGAKGGVFPQWLAALGGVAFVLLLLGAFFVPMAALPIWVLATSVFLLARKQPAATA